jgi:hypothetical protein
MISGISIISKFGYRRIAFTFVFVILFLGFLDYSKTQDGAVSFQIGYRVCEILYERDPDSEDAPIRYAGVPTDRFPLGFFFVTVPRSLALDLNIPDGALPEGNSQGVVEIYAEDGTIFIEQEILPSKSFGFINRNCAINIRNRQNRITRGNE